MLSGAGTGCSRIQHHDLDTSSNPQGKLRWQIRDHYVSRFLNLTVHAHRTSLQLTLCVGSRISKFALGEQLVEANAGEFVPQVQYWTRHLLADFVL